MPEISFRSLSIQNLESFSEPDPIPLRISPSEPQDGFINFSPGLSSLFPETNRVLPFLWEDAPSLFEGAARPRSFPPNLLAQLEPGAPSQTVRAQPDASVSSQPRLRPLRPGISLADFERPDERGLMARVTVVRLDLSRVELGLRPLAEHDFATIMQSPDVDVAVNAGFFGFGFTPAGLMVQGGRVLSPAGPNGGSGVLVVDRGRARLIPSDSVDPAAMRADLALQCGPRLIEADGSHGIRRGGGPRARRTAVCIRDGGRTLDLIVVNHTEGRLGPTLFNLATWLHEGLIPGESGCEAALNLDGGPSTGLYVRNDPSVTRMPNGIIVWALTARSQGQRRRRR